MKKRFCRNCLCEIRLTRGHWFHVWNEETFCYRMYMGLWADPVDEGVLVGRDEKEELVPPWPKEPDMRPDTPFCVD